MTSIIPQDDRHFIVRAADYLEKPGFLMRMANMIGKPLEQAAKSVPEKVHKIVEDALQKAMALAVRTVPTSGGVAGDTKQAASSAYWKGLWHTMATGATGAAGGMLGLAGLAIELPVSTGLMFRSIASIADDFGEDLATPESRLECLTVFSMGGPSKEDDAAESAYLATRLGLAMALQQAAQVLARSSADELAELVAKGGVPQLIRLIAQIASRFNLVVSEKLIAQSVPVIGAAGGAFINMAFADHFNNVARYHFGIRKLERDYGVEPVRAAYLEAARGVKAGARPALK